MVKSPSPSTSESGAIAPATLEPLRARPGARFTCWGDGVCCTDIHAFGPLSQGEVALLSTLDPRTVEEHEGSQVITCKEDGRCVFEDAGGCVIHARLGARAKPVSCQEFPFGFVATRTGGRVTTRHRCPCRSMGARELIDVEALKDVVRPDRIVRSELPIGADRSCSIERWEAAEATLLSTLEDTDPLEVLEAEPLRGGWEGLADEISEGVGESRFAEALSAFAAALRAETPPRVGWRDGFDRAESRTQPPEDPEAMLRDFVADWLWSLEWAFTDAFSTGCSEMATRVVVARRLTRSYERDGARSDRAMAEAIAVIELAALSDAYKRFVPTLPEGGPSI